MNRITFLSLIVLFASACSNYSPNRLLNPEELKELTMTMAPYLYKKPDHVAFEDRTKPENERHYRELQHACQGKFTHLKKQGDTLYFNFMYTDISSLYEHYKSFGGKVVLKDKEVSYINLYYHTPRLEPEDAGKVNDLLFGKLVRNGNVDEHIGNRELIHTPNDDFYYDTENKHWDYTPNSSWNFLKEVKEVEMPELIESEE